MFSTKVPLKAKVLRYSSKSFMTKELRKEIMKRSQLKKLLNEKRNLENWCKYIFQRNYCVNALRKIKIQYQMNLDIKEVIDNKNSGKAQSPSLTKITQIQKQLRCWETICF